MITFYIYKNSNIIYNGLINIYKSTQVTYISYDICTKYIG